MREAKHQGEAIKRFRETGCFCHKLGQNGEPDWLIVYAPGRHVYMEFKTETGGFTKAQRVRFRELLDLDHEIVLARNYAAAAEAMNALRDNRSVPLRLCVNYADLGRRRAG